MRLGRGRASVRRALRTACARMVRYCTANSAIFEAAGTTATKALQTARLAVKATTALSAEVRNMRPAQT